MSDQLSQDDIDKMLNQEEPQAEKSAAKSYEYLTAEEADTLGEIGNISMGAAATTLSMLLGNKVEITTPTVTEHPDVSELFTLKEDCITVQIDYTKGLDGLTVFKLDPNDSAIIADLMMGGTGKVESAEIGELQLSAVGEAMNQMIGTASTSLSSVFNTPIDITPPEVKLQKKKSELKLSKEIFGVPVLAVSFRLKIGDLVDSEMTQLMSLEAGQKQVQLIMSAMNQAVENIQALEPEEPVITQSVSTAYSEPISHSAPEQNRQGPVTVQPVQFSSFEDNTPVYGETNKNLDLLMDVKLRLTVELGRVELPIKKVLELTRGSVVELEKIAGEPVELFANGKMIAKGEVVVIEDNFGLRITSILSPDNRLKNI